MNLENIKNESISAILYNADRESDFSLVDFSCHYLLMFPMSAPRHFYCMMRFICAFYKIILVQQTNENI